MPVGAKDGAATDFTYLSLTRLSELLFTTNGPLLSVRLDGIPAGLLLGMLGFPLSHVPHHFVLLA
jgi:hypothetical protein